MSPDELDAIERRLGFVLPDAYRRTMLQYPFREASWAEQFGLPDYERRVLEMNRDYEAPGVPEAFFVGDDGGETAFFINLAAPDAGVWALDLASETCKPFASTWEAFLDCLRKYNDEAKRWQ